MKTPENPEETEKNWAELREELDALPGVLGIFCAVPHVALRNLLAALERGEMPTDDDIAWLCEGGARYLAAPGLQTIDQALGLEGMAYGERWYVEEAKKERRQLLHRYREEHLADWTPSGAAKEIERAAARFASTKWKRVAGLAEPPAEWIGTADELLFALHLCAAQWPLRWRRIQTLLKS